MREHGHWAGSTDKGRERAHQREGAGGKRQRRGRAKREGRLRQGERRIGFAFVAWDGF